MDLGSVAKYERAKAVPFRLVEPPFAFGQVGGELREHRLDGRLERKRHGSGAAQRIGDDLPRLRNDRLQMILAAEALRVDLEDVLGSGRARGEPAIVSDDF